MKKPKKICEDLAWEIVQRYLECSLHQALEENEAGFHARYNFLHRKAKIAVEVLKVVNPTKEKP